jgi:hypothetical protein
VRILTKERDAVLRSYHIQDIKENFIPKRSKTSINIHENSAPQSKEKDDYAVKQWLAERLKDKLQRASRLSVHTHKPILLYRNSIEESENAVEEEISYISGSHVVQIIYAYGGFVPSTFQTIEVFTLDKFTKWITQKRRKDLLLQCIEELEK